jgi:hypothetical protein
MAIRQLTAAQVRAMLADMGLDGGAVLAKATAHKIATEPLGASTYVRVTMVNGRLTVTLIPRERPAGEITCTACGLLLVPGEGDDAALWRTTPGGRYFCTTADDALHHPAGGAA